MGRATLWIVKMVKLFRASEAPCRRQSLSQVGALDHTT